MQEEDEDKSSDEDEGSYEDVSGNKNPLVLKVYIA